MEENAADGIKRLIRVLPWTYIFTTLYQLCINVDLQLYLQIVLFPVSFL